MTTIPFSVARIVQETLAEFRSDLDYSSHLALFGDEGVFDSLGLVSFVVAVEQSINDHREIPVSILSEKAFSSQNSPFKTIESFVKYIEQRIEESNGS